MTVISAEAGFSAQMGPAGLACPTGQRMGHSAAGRRASRRRCSGPGLQTNGMCAWRSGGWPCCATVGEHRAEPPAVTFTTPAASATARRSGHAPRPAARPRPCGPRGLAGDRRPGDRSTTTAVVCAVAAFAAVVSYSPHLRVGPGARPGRHGGSAASVVCKRAYPGRLACAAARGPQPSPSAGDGTPSYLPRQRASPPRLSWRRGAHHGGTAGTGCYYGRWRRGRYATRE